MIQKRRVVAVRYGTDMAVKASVVPTQTASGGVNKLPILKQLIEAKCSAAWCSYSVRCKNSLSKSLICVILATLYARGAVNISACGSIAFVFGDESFCNSVGENIKHSVQGFSDFSDIGRSFGGRQG